MPQLTNERKEYKSHHDPDANAKEDPFLPGMFAGKIAIDLAKHESPDHGSVDEQEKPSDAWMNVLTYQPRQDPLEIFVGLKLGQWAGLAMDQRKERMHHRAAEPSNDRVPNSCQIRQHTAPVPIAHRTSDTWPSLGWQHPSLKEA